MDDSHDRHVRRPGEVVSGFTDAGLRLRLAAYWPFEFELSAEQAALVDRIGAAARLRLQRAGADSWNCGLHWFRVVARKD